MTEDWKEHDDPMSDPFTVKNDGLAKDERVEEFFNKRISWLEKERRSGGDYKHLTARLEECQYIFGQLKRQEG